MALLHDATLTPTKRELLDTWLPRQRWFDGHRERGPVGSFRFDDPAGEVGMEGFLLGSKDGTLFVPLTYRPAPLVGAEAHLIGTTDHSVLGRRWVYDACGDPVWLRAVESAILTGGAQAPELQEVDGELQIQEPSVTVRGSGNSPVEHGAPVELVVARSVGELESTHTLTATWAGGADVVLAALRAAATNASTPPPAPPLPG